MSEEQTERSKRPESIHAGHRQRMQEVFVKSGMDGFSDVQVLEYLLGYALARVDTNVLAHRLLDEFGSLYRVFEAPLEQLVRVPGIGMRTACLLRFTASLWNRVELSKYQSERYFRTTKVINAYLTAQIGDYREERAFLLCLDSNCKMVDFRELSRGSVNSVNVPYRKVVEAALMSNASSVVLAHNHINGNPLPSVEDIEYTRGLHRALKLVNVALVDHVVVSEHTAISMRVSGMLDLD